MHPHTHIPQCHRLAVPRLPVRPRPAITNPPTRAFALPLVVLLILVVSLGLVVILQNTSAGYLAGRRQINVYVDHHRAAGLKELINRWLETSRDKLPDMIGPGGEAFELDIEDGQRVAVRISPAQGAALSDPGQLIGRRHDILEDMLIQLKPLSNRLAAAGQNDPERQLLRSVGPPEIDVNSAPEPVLEALVLAVLERRKATPVLKALLKRRGDGDLKPDDIPKVLTEAEVTPEEQAELKAMLTAAPTLWRAVATTRRNNTVVDLSAGYLQLDEKSKTGTINQLGLFLTWESMKVDEESLQRETRGSRTPRTR